MSDNWDIIGLGNDWPPVRWQAINWLTPNALSIWLLKQIPGKLELECILI